MISNGQCFHFLLQLFLLLFTGRILFLSVLLRTSPEHRNTLLSCSHKHPNSKFCRPPQIKILYSSHVTSILHEHFWVHFLDSYNYHEYRIWRFLKHVIWTTRKVIAWHVCKLCLSCLYKHQVNNLGKCSIVKTFVIKISPSDSYHKETQYLALVEAKMSRSESWFSPWLLYITISSCNTRSRDKFQWPHSGKKSKSKLNAHLRGVSDLLKQIPLDATVSSCTTGAGNKG